MKKIFTTTHWKRFSGLRIPILILGICSFLQTQSLNANNVLQDDEKVITGVITDANTGEALPGVSILIKGTTTGSITDVDGKFTLNAKSSDILVFSFVGFLSEEIPVGNQTEISISLTPDIIGLDEIVVIGYGVQKKKLVTGANLNVSGEDIQALNTTSSMDALKGLSPGVSITQNSGVPGAGNKVFIRGIGTIGNYKPLYIVDGIAMGDIDHLSPSDIEDIDVLKDAASAAIYGSRAANGVILVTTKKGKFNTATSVNYSGYYGWQNAYNLPEMLNAKQYSEIINRASINAGGDSIDFASRGVPYWDEIEDGTYEGTNWLELSRHKNAPVQSHSLNITGGSEHSTFSLGTSYFEQQGILGKQANNDYKRIGLRLNSEHILFKKNERNLVVIGQNLTYTNESNPTMRTGSIYWSDIRNMMATDPFLPMYAEDEDDPAYPYHFASTWTSGNVVNPIASMENNSRWNTNNNNTITGNAYLEIEPLKKLKIRSSFGINNWYGSSRHWEPVHRLGNNAQSNRDRDYLDQNMWSGYSWTSTSTASYDFNINSNHSFSILAGAEFLKTAADLNIEGHNENSVYGKYEYAYLDNFDPLDATNVTWAGFGSKDKYGWTLISYFGRLTYNFKETYLLNATLRYDGSSNFDRGNRWGTFPSFSAGWILSNEDFMQSTASWLSFMKLRASWGQNGNQDVGRSFAYQASITREGYNYFFGPDHSARTPGSTPSQVPNSGIHWETSEQTNVGTDMGLLNNKLQFSFDWYRKDTKDWLIEAPASSMNGTLPPVVNGGNIRNSGIEAMVRWSHQIGDFKYSVSGTFAYNKNEMTSIPSADSIYHGPASQLGNNTTEMFRCEEGKPVGFFWGYQTAGVIQDEEDLVAYNSQGTAIGDSAYYAYNTLFPGDLKFVDTNGDGVINSDDKVMIGSPHPDVIVGLQISLEYKGIYLNLTGYGQFGHQIAKSYRSADSPYENWTTEVYETWNGPGTSNRLPRVVQGGRRSWNDISDIYIYDADFFRISNVTIGYDLKELIKALPAKEFRIYGAVNNLYVFTKYNGMDPEVGYAPAETYDEDPTNDYEWGGGIDIGAYPSARTFMVGVNITF